MKIRIETPKGPYAIEKTAEGKFRATHHRLPTQFFADASDLFHALKDAEDELTLKSLLEGDTVICLYPETRHRVQGFRGTRYVDGTWDGAYLFFESVEAAMDAIQAQDLSAARAAF